MMNNKSVLGLGAATLAALITAGVLVAHRQPVNEAAAGVYAIADLQAQLNNLNSVTLKVAEDKTAVTLTKTNERWVVKERSDYPADLAKLRELLLKLADAKLLEQKTTHPERYATLGLADIKTKDAKGVLVSLAGAAPLKPLLVGDYNSRSNGTFVRHPDEQQSWLASGQLNIERDPANWLDKALLDLPTMRVAEALLTKAGSSPVRINKAQPTDDKFQLADLPAGREVQTDTILYETATALSNLTLTDVVAQAGNPAPEDKQPLKVQFTTFDGLVLNLQAWEKDAKHFAQFTAKVDDAIAIKSIQAAQAKAKADYDAKLAAATKAETKPEAGKATPAPTPAETPPLAVSDPAKDQQQRLDTLKAEVDTLNKRFQGWRFIIAPYKFAALNKSLEDLLKPTAAKAQKAG